jgi:hypothetical protein
MSSVDELLAFAAIACVLKKKERKRRKLWRKEWFNRNNYTHINLLQELQVYPKDWHNYLHMDEPTYLELLNMVSPHITKMILVWEKRSHLTKSFKSRLWYSLLCTFHNEGRSLNSSTNSDKNSFDHVAMAERREKDDISLCTWRLDWLNTWPVGCFPHTRSFRLSGVTACR